MRGWLTLHSASVAAIVAASMIYGANPMDAAFADGSGSCFRGRFGTAVDCGGGYVLTVPASPASAPASAGPVGPSVPAEPVAALPASSMYYVTAGPQGLCVAFGPATDAINMMWQFMWMTGSPQQNACPQTPPAGPAPAAAPVDPAALAEQFWQTIPLAVPRPSVPPGYGITGKLAYLVTGGTTSPPAYTTSTPIGSLSVQAQGRYLVDWGDPAQPGWQGPYDMEGQPWPDGRITHSYDYTGSYTITVEEQWTATWTLAGQTGTLTGLHTTATIDGFRVEQLQDVLTN